MKSFRSRKKSVQAKVADNNFNERWVRKFTTEVAGRSKMSKTSRNSFTLYKITSYIYPRDSPETLTALTILKRYNELRNLRKSLAKIHKQLNLPGTLPDYAHWGYFKRFDNEVIEERLQTTQQLLDFIALSPALFTSSEFVEFFQSSHLNLCSDDPSGNNIDNIRNSLLLPVEVIKPIEYQSSEEESLSISDSTAAKPTNQSFTKLSQNGLTEKTSLNGISTNLPDLLDHTHIEVNKNDDGPKFPDSSIILHCTPDSPMSSKYLDSDKLSLRENKHEHFDETQSVDKEVIEIKSISEKSSEINMSTDDMMRSQTESDGFSISPMCSSTSSLQNSYIFEAGYILHLGAQNEAEGNYRMAFDCYKAGIEKLLIGVQGETSELWRNLVKDKTDKYLGYAKNIYMNHLHDADKLKPSTKDDIFQNSILIDSKKMALCRPYEYLDKYKLVRLLNQQTMLVLCMETNVLCVLKVIQKNCTCASNDAKTLSDVPVLPYGVPYMVKLISYIETRNLIFLFLQYVPGENLFDYITKCSEDFTENNLKKNEDPITISSEKYGSNDSINEILIKSKKLISTINETLNNESTKNKTDTKIIQDIEIIPDKKEQTSPIKNIFSSKCSLKWAAELLIAIDHLHQRGVICHDLSPDNLLLGDNGHLTITYILGKKAHESLINIYNNSTIDLIYIAPELLNSPLHIRDEKVCDFWSYGAILYKLLLGENLSSLHPTAFNSHTTLLFPYIVPENVESLLNKLLCFDPNERLGSGPMGIDEIKFHPYFSDIDWNIVETEYDLTMNII